MMARIPINLSSEPFRRDRPMILASIAAAVALLGVLATLISLAIIERGRASDTREALRALEGQVGKMAAEQARLESVLRRPENAEVLERSIFLNNLLRRKGISWTRIFSDLESVMPHNVRLISIRPQVTPQNQILLDMVVAAQTVDPVIEMLGQLEASSLFGAVHVASGLPPSQSEPLFRYRVSVNYAQKL